MADTLLGIWTALWTEPARIPPLDVLWSSGAGEERDTWKSNEWPRQLGVIKSAEGHDDWGFLFWLDD